MGHEHRHARAASRRELAARIESEPADPQHRGPDEHHAPDCAADAGARETSPFSEDDRQHQGGDPGGGMDHDAAGEILDAHRCNQPPPHTQWVTGA